MAENGWAYAAAMKNRCSRTDMMRYFIMDIKLLVFFIRMTLSAILLTVYDKI
jgi:hypothetical protein